MKYYLNNDNCKRGRYQYICFTSWILSHILTTHIAYLTSGVCFSKWNCTVKKKEKEKEKERLILPWKKMAFLWNNKQSLNSTSLKWTPSFPFIKMTVCRHILQLEGEAAAGDSFKNRPNLENDSNVSQMLYPPNLACETLKKAVTFWGI